MKQTFYAAREIHLTGKSIPKGTAIGTVETLSDLPLEKTINAIARGFATMDKMDKPEPQADATPKKLPAADPAKGA